MDGIVNTTAKITNKLLPSRRVENPLIAKLFFQLPIVDPHESPLRNKSGSFRGFTYELSILAAEYTNKFEKGTRFSIMNRVLY